MSAPLESPHKPAWRTLSSFGRCRAVQISRGDSRGDVPLSAAAAAACRRNTAAAPLFTPYTLPGGLQLQHRIVYAPLTRCRAFNNVPQASGVPAAAAFEAQAGCTGPSHLPPP